MGNRYIIDVTCSCGHENGQVYYAPTCGFTTHECEECGAKIDLAEYTGITYENASNAEQIKRLVGAMNHCNCKPKLELRQYCDTTEVETLPSLLVTFYPTRFKRLATYLLRLVFKLGAFTGTYSYNKE